jgi:hypothetical protein
VIEPESRLEYTIPIVKVGFRRYTSMHGEKSDDLGTYDGFGRACDENIPSYSAKIQRPDTCSKHAPVVSQNGGGAKPTAVDDDLV